MIVSWWLLKNQRINGWLPKTGFSASPHHVRVASICTGFILVNGICMYSYDSTQRHIKKRVSLVAFLL